MELTNGDYNFLTQLARHVETYCGFTPPVGTPNKQYNAYRLLKHQDLLRLKRKIEKWQNTSTGAQATERR